MTEETPTRWSPQNPEEHEIVRRELNSILSSHHFKNSKRYPALLRYVVEKTLDGHSDQLKERTLGIEVFDRPPDYDTNADPVVRFSASEIRKRIAQFYHENDNESGLQIDLPLGSYVPEFKLKLAPAETHAEVPREQSPIGSQYPIRLSQVWAAAIGAGMDAFRGRRTRAAFSAYVLGPMILLIAIASLGAYALHIRHLHSPRPIGFGNRY